MAYELETERTTLLQDSRGDRYLSHSSRHTQVPVPATIHTIQKKYVLLREFARQNKEWADKADLIEYLESVYFTSS